MMLPILISVSVTPVSYFFCAVAGTAAKVNIKARISPESPRFPTRCVLMKPLQADCFAQRFMGFPLGQGVTAISSIVFLGRRTIAVAERCGKRGAIKGRFVARRFGAMRRKFGKLPLRSEGLMH